MKKGKEILKRKEKGITLIALVITIIVLLILAGVSIAMLTGENGILTQAQNAKEKTELSSEKEGIELAVQSSMIKKPNTLEITKSNLDEEIKEYLGNNKEFKTTDNKDGSFLVNLKNPDRIYYVDSTGIVISEENMLKISTADELKAFRDEVDGGNSYNGWYVYLTDNIILDKNEYWNPIGLFDIDSPDNSNKAFSGIFDGKNHKIDNIYINTTDSAQGLFALTNNGTIKNVIIGNNSTILGGNYTGGLIGIAKNKTKINSCSNEASITCSGVASGGVVGQLTENGLIIKCYNIGNVSSSGEHVGGICGIMDKNSIIEECYNTSNISGLSQYVGGIIGAIRDTSHLRNCYNTRND